MILEEKELTKEDNLKLLLEQAKFNLMEFKKKGVDMFLESKNRNLLERFLLEKLNEDIEYFKGRLNEK